MRTAWSDGEQTEHDSFRLVEAELNVLAQNIVHSDALTAMRLSEAARYGIAQK